MNPAVVVPCRLQAIPVVKTPNNKRRASPTSVPSPTSLPVCYFTHQTYLPTGYVPCSTLLHSLPPLRFQPHCHYPSIPFLHFTSIPPSLSPWKHVSSKPTLKTYITHFFTQNKVIFHLTQYLQKLALHKLWSSLSVSVLPPSNDLSSFKREVSRHLLS